MTAVKICGLREPESLKAAADAGADFIGLVFYPFSPRFIGTETARDLLHGLPGHISRVGVFVDPDNGTLDEVLKNVKLDMLQLHGTETPQRVRDIRNRCGLKVIKAFGIAKAEDLAQINGYGDVADWFLFDAKHMGNLPGGTGRSFDWTILKDRNFEKPWMLSGGLNAQNIHQALSILKPAAVDVSSGVEDAPGFKNPEKIRDFIAAVRETVPQSPA